MQDVPVSYDVLEGEVLVREIQRGKPGRLTREELVALDTTEEDAALAIQVEDARKRRYSKAMVLKAEIGMSDEERHELARMIPGVDKDDGGSWKELNPKQLNTLLDYLSGYQYIDTLIQQRAYGKFQFVSPGATGYTSGGTYTTSHAHGMGGGGGQPSQIQGYQF